VTVCNVLQKLGKKKI